MICRDRTRTLESSIRPRGQGFFKVLGLGFRDYGLGFPALARYKLEL